MIATLNYMCMRFYGLLARCERINGAQHRVQKKNRNLSCNMESRMKIETLLMATTEIEIIQQ